MSFGQWVTDKIDRAGGLNAFARLVPVAGSTVMAWRDERVFPLPDMVNRLAELTGEKAERLHQIVNHARMARALERRPPAPEVSGSRNPFRPQETTRRSQGRRAPRPAGDRSAARLRKPRRRGIACLIGSAALLAVAGASNAHVESQGMPSNYAKEKTSSVKWRRAA